MRDVHNVAHIGLPGRPKPLLSAQNGKYSTLFSRNVRNVHLSEQGMRGLYLWEQENWPTVKREKEGGIQGGVPTIVR